MNWPSALTKRSSTVTTLRLLALALATMAGPRRTSGVQMTKPWAPLAARLSMALRVFSPSGTPILMSSKPYWAAALSPPFHSYWNHGSSGCFTRKPSLIFFPPPEAEAAEAPESEDLPQPVKDRVTSEQASREQSR